MAGAAQDPWVVKIGGSVAGAPDLLRGWLAALAPGAGRVVLVPGGGPFADAVRDAQANLGFDDGTAHHLALLAMEQYGRALCALADGLAPAASLADLTARRREGRIPVWMPVPLTLGAPEIPASWEVTSDSLSAWLAGRLGARRLVLVKSAPRPPDGVTMGEAMTRELVDPAFGRFLPPDCTAFCLGPGDAGLLAAALADGGDPPGRLEPAHARRLAPA